MKNFIKNGKKEENFMKITIDIELEDLLTEVEDEESGNVYYQVAETKELHDNIKQNIESTILRKIRYKDYTFDKEAKALIQEHNDEIINEVIKKVTEKIMSSKKIVDFKRSIVDTILKEVE